MEAESRNFRIENFLDRFLFDVENSVEEIGIPECFRFDAGNDPSHRELAISENSVLEEDSSDLDGKSISEADDKNDARIDANDVNVTDGGSHNAADNVSCCSADNEVRSLDADADVRWCDADNYVNYCNANNDVNSHDADGDISCCEDTGNDSDTSGVSSWDPSDCELKIFPGTIEL